MGASIEGIATVRYAGRWRRPSSVGLAVRAARGAMRNAGCEAREIDLLIHAGVYPDDNVAEPAMAAFIQRRIGANPGALATSQRRTFSFDISNGSVGFVTALHVAAGYLRTGRIERALVVASDVDPTPRLSRGCPFEPAAAAVVLGSAANAGFSTFGFESFEKDSSLFDGRVDWIGDGGSRGLAVTRGRHALRIDEDDRYVGRCADHAAAAVERFLASHALAADDLDLVVPSWAPPGFPAAFAQRMPGDPRVLVPARPGRPHSAGPGFALEAGLARARATRAQSLLLVAAGSGISVALGLYHFDGVVRARGAWSS